MEYDWVDLMTGSDFFELESLAGVDYLADQVITGRTG
jgi:hypothetical protein